MEIARAGIPAAFGVVEVTGTFHQLNGSSFIDGQANAVRQHEPQIVASARHVALAGLLEMASSRRSSVIAVFLQVAEGVASVRGPARAGLIEAGFGGCEMRRHAEPIAENEAGFV